MKFLSLNVLFLFLVACGAGDHLEKFRSLDNKEVQNNEEGFDLAGKDGETYKVTAVVKTSEKRNPNCTMRCARNHGTENIELEIGNSGDLHKTAQDQIKSRQYQLNPVSASYTIHQVPTIIIETISTKRDPNCRRRCARDYKKVEKEVKRNYNGSFNW